MPKHIRRQARFPWFLIVWSSGRIRPRYRFTEAQIREQGRNEGRREVQCDGS